MALPLPVHLCTNKYIFMHNYSFTIVLYSNNNVENVYFRFYFLYFCFPNGGHTDVMSLAGKIVKNAFVHSYVKKNNGRQIFIDVTREHYWFFGNPAYLKILFSSCLVHLPPH